jgi:hypothetical protein
VIGRAVGDQDSGCDGRAEAVGKPIHLIGVDLDLLGECAGAGEGDHPIAGSEARHAFADVMDGSRRFAAGNERKVRPGLVLALHDQHVGVVHARGFNGDDDLARGGGRFVEFAEPQVRNRRKTRADDGFHSQSSTNSSTGDSMAD